MSLNTHFPEVTSEYCECCGSTYFFACSCGWNAMYSALPFMDHIKDVVTADLAFISRDGVVGCTIEHAIDVVVGSE